MALYPFDEGGGATVRDASGAGAPLHLTVLDATAVRWVPGAGMEILRPTAVTSSGPATKVSSAAMSSGQVTLEAWVTPSNSSQTGPARIATVSGSPAVGDVNVHLGQSATTASARLRTTSDGFSWIQPPGVFSSTTAPVHLVTTFDGTTLRLYVDGVVRSATREPGGDLSNWDPSFPLTVGNEVTLDRPWLGTVHLVAAYGRALSAAEVRENLAAGSRTAPPPTPPVPLPPTTGPSSRVDTGLVALYSFDEAGGNTAHDTSGVGTPLDLEVVDPASARWVPGGGIELVRPGAP